MTDDIHERVKALQLLDERLHDFEQVAGPAVNDPIYPLWRHHLQVMREEASALRVQLWPRGRLAMRRGLRPSGPSC